MNSASTEIILASGSPRRKELLAEMGMRFVVVTADVAEHDDVSAPHLAPVALAVENARMKALAVAKSQPGRWILGADTVVALGEKLFAKPASMEQAAAFLSAFSGRTHEVITGCALIAPEGDAEFFRDTTHVTFRTLSEETIARYLSEVHVLDKAGGYALQQRGEWIIEGVTGSRSNVVGLPTELLAQVFRRRGLL
jgi:septum formation protein